MLFILNGSGVPSDAKIVQVATLESIAVTPANPTIQTGETKQFTATGTYSNGRTQDITNQVAWTSSTAAGHYQRKWAGHGRVRWQPYHIRDVIVRDRDDWEHYANGAGRSRPDFDLDSGDAG